MQKALSNDWTRALLSEAAAYIDRSATLVREYVRRGLLVPERSMGGRLLFRREDLDVILAKRKAVR